MNSRWKVGCVCLVVAIGLTSRANADGMLFQSSSLPLQVRGEGLTEVVGAAVVQATSAGSIPAGSSITFSYPVAIANASSFNGASTAGLNCSITAFGGYGSNCGAGTTYFATSVSGSQFQVHFKSAVTFAQGDYLEVSGLRININALGAAATSVSATIAAISSAPTTNPITFTQSSVVIGSIVNPSVQVTSATAPAVIGTCAVPAGQEVFNGAGNGFSVTVTEKYPAAITSTTDEANFSSYGTISNGSLVNIVISNVPAGFAVQANGYTATQNLTAITGGTGALGSPAGSGSGYPGNYTVSLSGTPAFQVSTGAPLTYTFSVTNDSTSAIEKFTVQFGFGLPNSGNSGLSSSSGMHSSLGATVGVTASVVLTPVSGVVSFANNNDGTIVVAGVGDCPAVPVLTSIAPSIVGAASGGFTLTVNGLAFPSDSSVQWNGSSASVITTFVNAAQLTATIPSSFINSQGTASITVNSPSQGATTQPLTLTIGNPTGGITGVSPASVLVGSPGTTVTVTGSNFLNGAVVLWQGIPRNTTFVNSTTLTAALTTADFAVTGNYAVSVLNPSPVPGPSGQFFFPVNSPQPTITGLSPPSVLAGSGGFTLAVTGANFVGYPYITFNGNYLFPTIVSTTTLSVSVPYYFVGTPEVVSIVVYNPTPSLANSSPVNFYIDNPQPALTSLSMDAAQAGAVPFPINVYGVNFVNGAVVLVNGNSQPTTYNFSQSLTFTPTTQELASPGTWLVTVVNPPPSVGASNALTFTVNPSNPVPAISLVSPSTVAAGSGPFTLNVYGSGFLSTSVVKWGGSARNTTFVSAQQLTATINAADVMNAGPVAVTVFSPTPGGGTSSPLTFNVGSSSQGTLAAQSVNGSPGAPVAIPVVLNLNNVAAVGALSFTVQVTPANAALPITAPITFQSDAALPVASNAPPTLTSTNSSVAVSYGSFTASLSGQVTIGVVQAFMRFDSTPGQTYTVHVAAASAAQGGTAVPLSLGDDVTLALVNGYAVGDTYPHTGDTVGSFGDGSFNTLDLIDVLRAVTGISTPATCSDRFDAMDSSPVDTATARGGDGILNTLDLIETLRLVTNLEPVHHERTPRGLTCPQIGTDSRRSPAASAADATIEVEGNAIYLVAQRDLNLKGLAISFRLQEGQQANFTPGEIPTSIVDVGQPGKIAMAWLNNGITLASGQRLLLGSVDGVDRGALLGVSANDRSGEEVRIAAGAVRVR